MNKLFQFFRTTLALLLTFTMVFGMCANGIRAVEWEDPEAEDRKDAILKEFFGDGVSVHDAYDILMTEAAKMVDYENQPFQYVPDEDSFFVTLGDETAVRGSGKDTVFTYHELVTDHLDGVESKNHAKAQMLMQDIYTKIAENTDGLRDDVAKADLIALGWSSYGATYNMFYHMGYASRFPAVTDQQWIDLVGEENFPLVEELLRMMFQKVHETNITSITNLAIEDGLEWYAFTYMSNIINQAQVIEAIRVINPNAVIVLVGTYNDLNGIVVTEGDQTLDLGAVLQDFVNVYNLLSLKNSQAYDRVAYVHAPDVSTNLLENLPENPTIKSYIWPIVGRQTLPNAKGHAYIAEQFTSSISDTCTHTWDEGKVTSEATCNEDGANTFTCTWCGEKKTEAIPATGEHKPATREENRKEPTCAADGSYDVVTYCADCGTVISTESNSIPATGNHTYEPAVTKEPTCEENGVMTYTCAVCGDAYEEDIPALGHDYQAVVTDPTCTEKGFTTYTCSLCGDSYIADEVDALGHSYGEWVQTKAPSCTEEGEESRTCASCGDVETRTIDKVDHAYEAVVTDPTCSAGGYTTYTCSVCGDSYVGDEVPALDHTFGDWTQTKAPTCIEEGEESRECAACGHVETRAIAKVDHVYEAVVTEPTCTEAGFTTYTCAVCGDSYTADEVAALGHAYGEWTQTKAPSCIEEGEESRVCQNCGNTETRVLEKIDHVYEAVVTAPTCTEKGFTTHTCSVCGDSYVTDEVDALGHDWQTTTVDETCCEAGQIIHTCAVCDAEEVEIIPANGEHDLVYTDNENGVGHTVSCRNSGNVLVENELHEYVDQICTKCDAEEVCQHEWDEGVVTSASSCSVAGQKLYTCTRCESQYTEKLALDPNAHTGNNHTENAKEPTCVQPGYTGDTVCECGVIIAAGEEIAVVEHSYEAVVTAPTCTEGGYTTYTCTACGASYVADQTEPTGHNWDEGVVTKEPTTTEEGEKTYTCIDCGEHKTEVLEKVEEPEFEPGDANGDGKVNARDARLALRYAAKLIGDDELDAEAADINGDGKVNARDARAMLRKAAGLE